jgi:hypothetical protein
MSALDDFGAWVQGQGDPNQALNQANGYDADTNEPVPKDKKIYYVATCDTEGNKWLSDCSLDYANVKAICDAHAKATGHQASVLITNVGCPRPPDPPPPVPDPGPPGVAAVGGDQDTSGGDDSGGLSASADTG